MDHIDWQIIAKLQSDGRTPFTAIAAELNVAEGTIRNRVTRLIEEGYLRISGILNPQRLGKMSSAIVGVRVRGGAGPQISEILGKWPEVRYLAFCAGEYDLIIQVVVDNNQELFNFLTGRLRELPGVESSDTSLILSTCKESEEWFPARPEPWPEAK